MKKSKEGYVSGRYDAVVFEENGSGEPVIYISLDEIIKVVQKSGVRHDLHSVKSVILQEYVGHIRGLVKQKLGF